MGFYFELWVSIFSVLTFCLVFIIGRVVGVVGRVVFFVVVFDVGDKIIYEELFFFRLGIEYLFGFYVIYNYFFIEGI